MNYYYYHSLNSFLSSIPYSYPPKYPFPHHYPYHHHRHRLSSTVSCSLRRHHRRRRTPKNPNQPKPSDEKVQLAIDFQPFSNKASSLPFRKLFHSSQLRFNEFVQSGNEALEDLMTMITVDADRRVIISCRPSTVRFVGNLVIFGFVVAVSLRVLVKLGLGFWGKVGFRNKSGVVRRRDRSLGGREVVVATKRINTRDGEYRALENPLASVRSTRLNSSEERRLSKIIPTKFNKKFLFPFHPLLMIRFSPLSLTLLVLISSVIYESSSSSIINPSKAKQVSSKPRAFVYEGFLTEEECNHLISLAKSELKRSAVADHESGKSKLSEVRTSSGMFIAKGKDPIVDGIEDKIAMWTFLPKDNGEDIQVLRYEHGQKYDPHYDYFADPVNIARGGHRIATVLMYLSDVAKGGETVFPSAEIPHSRHKSSPSDEDLSECAKKGIAVKPRKGDALLFFSLHPSAIPDPSSLHGGCSVIEGEKWSATKWIHVDSFDKIIGSADGNCTNNHENCERWAALGECTKNPEYMAGTPALPGYCRRSCNVC